MSVKKGRELTFKWGGSKVGNITSISLTVDGETINITDFDSGEWNDKLAGNKDWTMELGLYHNPEDDAVQETLESDMFTTGRSDTANFGPDTPQSGDVNYEGSPIMSSLNIDASGANEAVTSSVSLEGNGALTRNVTA